MSTTAPIVPRVFAAINAVQAALAKSGITKGRKNQQQGYSFRGIDEIYNALSGLLAEHKLVILPSFADRLVTERASKTGGALFGVTVRGEFTFVSSEDGSSTKVATFGEAMDSADKATNKAMSAAYKYACLQAFCIPTEGDNDADAHTHEVAGKSSTHSNRPDDHEPDPLAGAGRAAHVPGRWQDCLVHFGKNKGKKLGDLPANTLKWYITEWQPKPGYESDEDTVLRQMLDKARDELEAGATGGRSEIKPPASAKKATPAADDDEIPF